MVRRINSVLVAAVALAGLACEPGSVGDARDQLAREADGVLQLTLPIADTTYLVSELLQDQDTTTTPDGLLGVRIQADTLTAVNYGQFLSTDEVTTAINVSLLNASVAAMMPPGSSTDTLGFTTPAGSDVIGGTVESGYLVRSITNNTGCAGTADLTVVDALGATVVGFPTATVADGATAVDSVSAAGVSVNGFIELSTNAAPVGSCIPNIGANVASAITIRPLTLTSVTLDNVAETFSVEEYQEIDAGQVNFEDLEDAIRQSTLHSAYVDFAVNNSAGLPIVIDNFTIGAVPLDQNGQPMRNGSGGLLYEQSSGAPILITIADPGQTSLSVGRQATKSMAVNAAALVDRVVDMVLDGDRVAIVAEGDATGGDGTLSTLTNQDDVNVSYDFSVGLDITIPPAGVSFTTKETMDGIALDSDNAADIADRLISVALTADAMNYTPFGVELEVALAPGEIANGDDVFVAPGAVLLSTVVLDAPLVDGAGLPLAPISDIVSLAISGQDSEIVLGDQFTAGIRIRLIPGLGANGRGAVRPNDGVAVDASVDVQIRRGN